jgi:uncharacterized membrane protein
MKKTKYRSIVLLFVTMAFFVGSEYCRRMLVNTIEPQLVTQGHWAKWWLYPTAIVIVDVSVALIVVLTLVRHCLTVRIVGELASDAAIFAAWYFTCLSLTDPEVVKVLDPVGLGNLGLLVTILTVVYVWKIASKWTQVVLQHNQNSLP